MNKNIATAAIVLVAAVVLSGCGLSETRLSDDTTPVASTSPSEAATPSSEATTPAPRTTNSPSSPAETDNTPTPSITKTPKPVNTETKPDKKPVNTATKPDKKNGASKPAKSVIPCGMMDIKTKEMGKNCPPPIVPAEIIIGESYPWFPVAPGKLAEPWGITGELLFANDFITVLQITPTEIVVVRDDFSRRHVLVVFGATSVEVETRASSTFVKFMCNGVEANHLNFYHYNVAPWLPVSLWVQYEEKIRGLRIAC